MSNRQFLILLCWSVLLFLLATKLGSCAGQADSLETIKTISCQSACDRRHSQMSHTYENQCVCENGKVLHMDLGAMYVQK